MYLSLSIYIYIYIHTYLYIIYLSIYLSIYLYIYIYIYIHIQLYPGILASPQKRPSIAAASFSPEALASAYRPRDPRPPRHHQREHLGNSLNTLQTMCDINQEM